MHRAAGRYPTQHLIIRFFLPGALLQQASATHQHEQEQRHGEIDDQAGKKGHQLVER